MTEHSHDDGRVHSPDGLSIYWQRWLPEAPKAIMLFVHGLGEHSGRYLNLVEHLTPQGFGCYGLDYRAHGRSPGLRVHVDRFDQFLMDLGAVHGLVRREHPGLPIFLMGHSQGGLIVLLYALEYPKDIPGVVISSPFLGIHDSVKPNAVVKVVAPILSQIFPKVLFPNNVDATYLSHDPDVVTAYKEDPLVSGKVSARWFTSLLEAQRKVLDEAPTLSMPALVMQSGGDRLVDVEATRRWVEHAPKELVEYEEWEGFYHEMLNELEPDRRRVLERMDAWLEPKLEG
jgi:alpha-beta hydrolase superfamily lysophospholipase